MLTVATLGIDTLLVALAIVVPAALGPQPASERIAAPFVVALRVGTVVLSANDLIAAVVAPLAMIGVAVFLNAAPGQRARRAGGRRARDRAAMLGIPVGRLSTIVWSLAAVLSFLAVFLQSTASSASRSGRRFGVAALSRPSPRWSSGG